MKLTETLAEETRPHGVSVFSVDPGLLPIGLGEAALKAGAGGQTPEGRVHRWIRDQFAAGRSAWSCLRIVPVRPGRWPTQARAARALVKKLMFVPGTRPAGPATQPVRHAFRGVAVGL